LTETVRGFNFESKGLLKLGGSDAWEAELTSVLSTEVAVLDA